jgi:hypothetical protein
LSMAASRVMAFERYLPRLDFPELKRAETITSWTALP